MSFTFGSLFSGIGGLDLGLERAGLRCVWQVEINEYARRVLAKHWPEVRRHDDIKTFPPGEPEEWLCDVIAGGFPCKQTSAASAVHGRRMGLDGPDSGLWHQMLRVISEFRPRYAIVENVDAVSTWSSQIARGLEAAGYRVSECRASAWDSGAPHLRRRLFFLADRDGSGLEITWAARASANDVAAWRAAHRDDWLAALAGVLRVDDGVPGGVDRRERIQAIGNAVCPAVAEWIGRRLLEELEVMA